MVFYKYDKESIRKKIATDSQAHCLVAQAASRPKPAKEHALPTHRLTGIKHKTLIYRNMSGRNDSAIILG